MRGPLRGRHPSLTLTLSRRERAKMMAATAPAAHILPTTSQRSESVAVTRKRRQSRWGQEGCVSPRSQEHVRSDQVKETKEHNE
jgi:hypothetical protein